MRLALPLLCLCLMLSADDSFHRRLLLPPCDAYANSTGKLQLFNGGGQPVRLRNVRYSCGCLTGTYPKNIIKPGEHAEIQFTLSPNGKGGQIQQKAWLEFEWDRKEKTITSSKDAAADAFVLTEQVQVEVQLFLLSRLRLGLDKSMLDFSSGLPETVETIHLTGSAEEARIVEVVCPQDSGFKYKLSEGRRSLEIAAIYDEKSPRRHFSESWILKTSDEQVPELPLLLNQRLQHDFTVMPEAIEVHSNTKMPLRGCLLVKSVHLRKPIKVLAADWQNATGTVEVHSLPKGLTRISYSLEAIAEKDRAYLRIATSSSLQPQVNVMLSSP